MTNRRAIVFLKQIESLSLVFRDQRVILAVLYSLPTKALNQAVKRNRNRFPEDFMFQLTKEEKLKVVTNCDHLAQLKFSSVSPYAFTEHGAIMPANVLNSKRAVKMSVYVVSAFVRLRTLLASHEDLTRKLDTLEKKYDKQFRVVSDAIRQLMLPPSPKRKNIGFVKEDE